MEKLKDLKEFEAKLNELKEAREKQVKQCETIEEKFNKFKSDMEFHSIVEIMKDNGFSKKDIEWLFNKINNSIKCVLPNNGFGEQYIEVKVDIDDMISDYDLDLEKEGEYHFEDAVNEVVFEDIKKEEEKLYKLDKDREKFLESNRELNALYHKEEEKEQEKLRKQEQIKRLQEELKEE